MALCDWVGTTYPGLYLEFELPLEFLEFRAVERIGRWGLRRALRCAVALWRFLDVT
jgi:hypothetical protein